MLVKDCICSNAHCRRLCSGPNATDYLELNRRAALVSLLLQSPKGELPTGEDGSLFHSLHRRLPAPMAALCHCVCGCAGARSSQHQWNEAVSCVTFEYWANAMATAGDAVLAGAFKRAAALSLRSLARWKRPTGEWFIVKNQFDPALRHGYESYSYYSQVAFFASCNMWACARFTVTIVASSVVWRPPVSAVQFAASGHAVHGVAVPE
jgi:hypothetical protein